MLKAILKVVNDDTDNFFNTIYRSYGPYFFLAVAGVFFLLCVTPGIAEANGWGGHGWMWAVFSAAWFIMGLDMIRQERKGKCILKEEKWEK